MSDDVEGVKVETRFGAAPKGGIGAVVVSALVVFFFGAVLMILTLRPADYSPAVATLLNVLLGTAAAGFMTVVNYWLGSSAGSKAKDDIISNIHRSGGDGLH